MQIISGVVATFQYKVFLHGQLEAYRAELPAEKLWGSCGHESNDKI
ncbi:hypothetical protein [Desulfotalea psychrophila]|nr:hypothetical protein [Desulfotalea psychrophila]